MTEGYSEIPTPDSSEVETPQVIGPVAPEDYVTTEASEEAAQEPETAPAEPAAETPAAQAAEGPAASAAPLPSRVAEEHARRKRHPVLKALLIIVLFLLVVGGTGAAYLYHHDQQMADVVPNGVSFYHTSFGGLTNKEVAPKVDSIIAGLNAQEIDLETTGTPQVVQVKSFVKFDTATIVNDITSVRAKMSLTQRLRYDWLHESAARTIPLPYSIDETAVASAVTNLAKSINGAAVDATLSLPTGGLVPVITPGKTGITIETSATATQLTQAIKSAVTENKAQRITVQTNTTEPEVTSASLASERIIVVCLSQKTMWLYQGTTLMRAMVTATGAPEFATRPGDYFIGVKRYNPTWINPGDDWAKSMPKEIGPGPGNPLGPRAMNVDQRNSIGQIVDYGYRIHAGTTGGSAWSHGCLHLSTSDVIWLYDQVKVGTPVLIRP